MVICNAGTDDLSVKTGCMYQVLSCDNEWVILKEQPGVKYRKARFDLSVLNPTLEKTPKDFSDDWFRNAALMLPVYYDSGDLPKLLVVLNTLQKHVTQLVSTWGEGHTGRPDLVVQAVKP